MIKACHPNACVNKQCRHKTFWKQITSYKADFIPKRGFLLLKFGQYLEHNPFFLSSNSQVAPVGASGGDVSYNAYII